MGMDINTTPLQTTRTFRTFVTGPSNALAYNAALAVARAPGAAHNPLHLRGVSGNGKTHLLSAIAAYLAPRVNGAEVILTSGDAFARGFAAHLHAGRTPAFRRRYHRAAALLIDDVAGIAVSTPAATELIRVIDALRASDRQVVTADAQRPGAMHGLPAGLRARLGTAIATLGAPDAATRLAACRREAYRPYFSRCGKAKERLRPASWPQNSPQMRYLSAKHVLSDRLLAVLRRGAARDEPLPLPDEALVALAARLRGSVREAEEALVSLVDEARAQGGVASPHLARQVAGDINRAARCPHGPVTADAVLAATCDYYALPHQTLLSKSRAMTVAQARQVAMYLLREDAGLTAVQTGQRLGRDHSTVLSGYARIATAVGAGDTAITAILQAVRDLAREHQTACA